jgi:large subunit ribosomal protein L10
MISGEIIIMALTKNKKVEVVDQLSKLIADVKTLVFVKFDKLTVKDVNELRSSLRKEDVGYKVAKKTLLKRVLTANNYQGEMPTMEGEIAVAYGTDEIAPARGVYEFQKGHKDFVSIVGGVFEGAYKTQAEMMEIAMIPGMQTLRGMFANVINSPIQRLVIALDQIAAKKQ